MLTRGFIIGKIIDDLSTLDYQISARNKLGQFDLTKVCEDFFKEVLNCVYGISLLNLNRERNNNPGLDLGDERAKIAYQVTSLGTSQKINNTLAAITTDQLMKFLQIRILVIGKKQSRYSLSGELAAKAKFDERSIFDIYDLMKEIVVLDIDILYSLNDIFTKEFRGVKIDLEPMDQNGDFESSNYHRLEKIPQLPPKNAKKIEKEFDDDFNYESITELYMKLASTPRISREYLAIIAERGQFKGYNTYMQDQTCPK